MRAMFFSVAIVSMASFSAMGQENFVYKESFPPKLVSVDLASFEVADQAFPFYDGSLLLPDSISLAYFREKVTLQVVQENEEESFDPLAVFEFEDWYSIEEDTYRITGDELPDVERDEKVSGYLFFKQRMWLKGLLYAAREYEDIYEKRFRADAFRVDFRETGDRIRPSVILYKRKGAREPYQMIEGLKTELQNIEKRLKEINDSHDKTNGKLNALHVLSKSMVTELTRIKNIADDILRK